MVSQGEANVSAPSLTSLKPPDTSAAVWLAGRAEKRNNITKSC